MTTGNGSDRTRRLLQEVRRPLLQLHRALLEAERIGYEKEHGRIAGGGQLLQLVIGDPWFAWLRPMSGLIVMIDEHLEAKELPPPADAENLLVQVRAIITPDDRFRALLQNHPELPPALAAVTSALRD